MTRSYLNIDHVTKYFSRNGSAPEVLKHVDLAIARGGFVSIIGHSGCGKSSAPPPSRRIAVSNKALR